MVNNKELPGRHQKVSLDSNHMAFLIKRMPAADFLRQWIWAFCSIVFIGISGCAVTDEPKPVKPSVQAPVVVPAPIAAFNSDNALVAVLDRVKFVNTSANATRYEWDFGNGKVSTDVHPYTTFDSAGIYSIKLTAFNSEGKVSEAIRQVTVGEWYWTGFTIDTNDFPGTYGNLDAGDGPDLNLKFTRAGAATVENFTLKPDLEASDLPYTFTIPPVKISNEVWTFSFEELDPGVVVPLGTWDVNLYNSLRYCYSNTCHHGLSSHNKFHVQLNMEIL